MRVFIKGERLGSNVLSPVSQKVYEFAEEFVSIFPEAQFVKRGSQFEIKKIVEIACKRDFTDVIVINEDRKQPSKSNCAPYCNL